MTGEIRSTRLRVTTRPRALAVLLITLLLASGCGDDTTATSTTGAAGATTRPVTTTATTTTSTAVTATSTAPGTTISASTTTVPEPWCISAEAFEPEPGFVIHRAPFDLDGPDAPAGGSVVLVGQQGVELPGPALGADVVDIEGMQSATASILRGGGPTSMGFFDLTGPEISGRSDNLLLSVETTELMGVALAEAWWCYDGSELTSAVTLLSTGTKPASAVLTLQAIVDGAVVAATAPVLVETRFASPPVTGPTYVPGTWDPILATQTAGPTPELATCSGRSAAVVDERPMPFEVAGVAFDPLRGMVFAGGGTWAYDVCAGAWSRIGLNGLPDPGFGSPDLAYDADSDVMFVFEFEMIGVYDHDDDAWTGPTVELPRPGGYDGDIGFGQALYDPVSGLILATDSEGGDRDYRVNLLAIDYDAGSITVVGGIPVQTDPGQIELLGYVEEIDRLLIATGWDTFALVDPRTGEATLDVPSLPWLSSGRADGTVYVTAETEPPMKRVCRFVPDPPAWECFDHATGSPDDHVMFGAIIGDPIHDRVLLIHSVPVVLINGQRVRPGGQMPIPDGGLDDIWALDVDTGAWTQVLEPSGVP